MPKGVYLICCETAVVDGTTGLVSYLNVFDSIHLTPVTEPNSPPEPGAIPGAALRMRISAMWRLKEGESAHDRFEHEFLVYMAGQESGFVTQKTPVRFEKSSHRLDANFFGLPPHPGPVIPSGQWMIVSRIRKIGTELWDRQEYPIQVEVDPAPETQADEPG